MAAVDTAVTPELAEVRRPVSWRYTRWGRFLRDPSAVLGSFLLTLLIISAIAAPILAPHDPGLTNLQLLHLDNTQVTDAGAQRLQRALPDCQISYGSLP